MADNMESLAGVTAESMADEILANGEKWRIREAVPGLAHVPLLVPSSDDGLAPGTDSLVMAVRSAGNKRVTAVHKATDHSLSDKRIALESVVVNWLARVR